ncbi:MAG: c-type cytochrome [Magnetococcus sp. WYHC-3]
MRNKWIAAGTLGLALGLASPAVMAWNEGGGEQEEALHMTPNPEAGRKVYEICSTCHMPEGWGLEDGTFPQLAGQHVTVTIKQLADIRAMNRDNPTMYPFSLPSEIGGPQAIADVAAYIAQLPFSPTNGVGPGTDLARGKSIYDRDCARCHGHQGEGDASKFHPLLQGQHYKYLLRQLEWIRDGRRRNSNPVMVQQISSFTPEELAAVADYASRLKPPKEKIAPEGWVNPDFK